MEDRLAVGAEENEVAVFRSLNPTANEVINDHRGSTDLLDLLLGEIVKLDMALALQPEPPCAVLLIGPAFVGEDLKLGTVEVAALGLEIGAVRALSSGTLIPIHPQPAHTVEQDPQRLIGITLLIRILDSQDKRAPRVPSIQPVKEGRTRTPDVEETRGAGREAGANRHGAERGTGRHGVQR